jgi:hypothetical protein
LFLGLPAFPAFRVGFNPSELPEFGQKARFDWSPVVFFPIIGVELPFGACQPTGVVQNSLPNLKFQAT